MNIDFSCLNCDYVHMGSILVKTTTLKLAYDVISKTVVKIFKLFILFLKNVIARIIS